MGSHIPGYVSSAVQTNMVIVYIPIGSIWCVFNVISSGRETIEFVSSLFSVFAEISDKKPFLLPSIKDVCDRVTFLEACVSHFVQKGGVCMAGEACVTEVGSRRDGH